MPCLIMIQNNFTEIWAFKDGPYVYFYGPIKKHYVPYTKEDGAK